MKHKTLIFDFDGTIADTHLFLVEIYNSYSDEFNYKKIDVNRLEKYKDKNAAQIIRHLKIPILKIPAIITRAKSHFFKDIEKIKPFDGLKEVLKRLKHSGHHMGIISSNSKENIHAFLKNHDLEIFDFIHSTKRVLSKDSAIKKVVQEMNLSLKDAIYIGDEIRDIEAAKKMGIRVAAVTWGYNSKRALASRKPDLLIHTPDELITMFDRLP